MDSIEIKEDSIRETCVICEKTKEKGIHIYTQFICSECESEIIATETNDEKYKYYLYQLRKITQPIVDVK